MEKILGILDFEVDFSNNLMDYLNRRKGFGFHTRVFTNIESLNKCLKETHLDVLLIGEDVFELLESQITSRERIGRMILLSEGRCVKEAGETAMIYKFQSAEDIMREILLVCEASYGGYTRSPRTVTGEPKIYGVYSPCGGSGKTCLALAAALELSGRGETLYVSLEPYSVLSVLMKQQPEQGISDWIYYLKQTERSLPSKLRSVICRKDSLDYVAGPANGADLCEMNEEDAKRLLVELSQIPYQYVVLDVGIMSEGCLTLLRGSVEVWMPVGNGFLEEEKETRFFEQLNLSGETELMGKIKRLIPPKDENLKREFGLWQLRDGRLGEYVREVV